MMASVWELAGVDVVFSGMYSAWQPNPNSPMLLLMESVYQNLYGQQPKVTAIHAGLEAGTIKGTYPNMDAISLGHAAERAHAERKLIATVKKLNDLLWPRCRRSPWPGPIGHC